MTAMATAARAAAVHFEAKKTGFGQAQDGWSLTLRIADADVPPGVRDAKKGTRFVVALVEIGDDEAPVMPAAATVEAPTLPDPVPTPPASRKWAELPLPQQAAMRIAEPEFQRWIAEGPGTLPLSVPKTEAGADRAIKALLGITSKRDLASNHFAALEWLAIDREYRAHLADRAAYGDGLPEPR